MRVRILTSCVVVGVLAFLTGQVVSQEGDKGQPPGKPGSTGDPNQAMTEAWTKAAEPGEHHEHLKPLVGNWNLRVQWRMTPEAEWTEEKATSEFQWIMGGRFLMEKVKGIPHQPDETVSTPVGAGETETEGVRHGGFEGLGFLGYDNLRKKHTALWIDNMTTATSISYGTCDNSRKVMTLVGDGIDHMTRQPRKEKSILRIINNDKLVGEMYVPGPDGREFKSMEITYTRK